MLTFKRALIIAGLVLFIFFYTSPSQQTTSEPDAKKELNSVRGGSRPKVEDSSLTQSAPDKPASTSRLTSSKTPVVKSDLLTGGGKPSIKEPEPEPELIKLRPSTQNPMGAANIRNRPLTEQLAYQFPYDVSAKFPAFIWQTWKYTPAHPKFDDNFRIAETTWTEKHPEFIHEVRAPALHDLFTLIKLCRLLQTTLLYT